MPLSPHDAQPAAATEASLLEAIVARLVPAFPDLDEREVRDAVIIAHREPDGARLRQFVPLLVERDAKAACRQRRPAARQAGAAEGGRPPPTHRVMAEVGDEAVRS